MRPGRESEDRFTSPLWKLHAMGDAPDPDHSNEVAMPYKLNVNEGVDTLHQEHPYEECNSDDGKDMQEVDDETATTMFMSRLAKSCKHCKPFEAT